MFHRRCIALLVCLLAAGAVRAAVPHLDTGFEDVTPTSDVDVILVREQAYGAAGVDLSAYGIPGGPHDFVQSLYVRLYTGGSGQESSFSGLMVFPESVTVLGIITDRDDLGGEADDGLYTASDSLFAVAAPANDYSAPYRGFEYGSGSSSEEFIGLIDEHSFAFGLNVALGLDDFRVIIDYGDAFPDQVSFDLLAVDVGTINGITPFTGIRVGDDLNPVVWGSGDYGETPSLRNIPLIGDAVATPDAALPFQQDVSLFMPRDTPGLTYVDGYDTVATMPLPGLFEMGVDVSNPRGITDHENGLIYTAGRDGGFGIIDPWARTTETTLMANLSGNVVDITNLPGTTPVFGVRNTPGDSEIDLIDPTVPVVMQSWTVPDADTPVAIADATDGLLYVLGEGGALAWSNADGTATGSVSLSPPAGTYDGMTSLAGSPYLYLVRNTAGDTSLDRYDVTTGTVEFDWTVFPVPATPSDITDGPAGLLYIIGDGDGEPSGFTCIDPANGQIVFERDILDFWGVYRTITGITPDVSAAEGAAVPRTAVRHTAWPNPFNPQVEIAFEMPRDGRARVRLLDLKGRVVRTLADGPAAAGWRSVRWDGRNAEGRAEASGAYVYLIEADGKTATGTITLTR